MGAVAGIVSPVFALVLLGAAARYWRLLDLPGVRGLNDLTFYLAIPALLFVSVAEAPALHLVDVALLYFGACVAVFGVAALLGVRLLGARLAQAAVLGLNAAYGNTVMLGIPLVSAAFGPEGLGTLLSIVALHSVLLLPLATLLIEADGRATRNPFRFAWQTAPALLRNPVIMAIVIALGCRAFGVPVGAPLHRLLGMLAEAAPTLALFTLGASLPDFAAQGSARETGLATVLKLVALPLLVWAAAALTGLAPLPTAVAVLTAGTPTGANAFFLARRTGNLAAASAGTVVVSTVLSFFTLSVILAWLRP